MIVFLTKDLFFIPVLQSAGNQQGVEVAALLSLDSPKAAAIDPAAVTTCVIDLTVAEAAAIGGLVSELSAKFPAARVVAFGPHVQAERLAAARSSGCDQVLTRGQLNSQIDQLMGIWASHRDQK